MDPKYARAYAGLAWTYFDEYLFQWSQDPNALSRGVEAARKAVALNPSLAEARRTLGHLLLYAKEYDDGLRELEKAVELDSNFSWANAMLAYGLIYTGKPDEAVGFAKRALRLDPKCEAWVAYALASSYFWLRRYDDAIVALNDVVRRNPNYLPAHTGLAATYAELGREKEARAEAAEVLRINPNFKLELLRRRLPYKSEAYVDRVITALQKAGLS